MEADNAEDLRIPEDNITQWAAMKMDELLQTTVHREKGRKIATEASL